MIDPLYRLPSELRLEILSRLSSILNLNCALSASPALAEAFNSNYFRRIFCTILNGDETGAELLQGVITVAGAARSSSLYTLLDVKTAGLGLGTNLAQDEILNRLGYAVIVELLRTNEHLNKLANLVLGLFLDRLHSLEFRRGDPPDSTTEFGEYLHSIEYEPKLDSKPSWIEHHRVLRALWRIQLFFDLRKHPFCSFMCAKGLHHLWTTQVKIRFYEWEEMACVVNCLQDYSALHSCKIEDLFKEQSDAEVISDLENHLIPTDPETSHRWQQSRSFAAHRCPAYRFYQVGLNQAGDLFRQCSFRQLGVAGFIFWDLKRMVNLGLLRSPDGLADTVGEPYHLSGAADQKSRWYHILKDTWNRRIREGWTIHIKKDPGIIGRT